MRHLATLLLVCVLLAGAQAARAFPNRVVVALSGDSIVDGGGVVAPAGIGAARPLPLRADLPPTSGSATPRAAA